MWDAAALFQHVSFIFSSSSPSPQIKHSQGAPEQPHPSSSHEAVPADGGHRLLPSLRSQSLLSCQQLREQHRTCAGRPLPFTSVQLSPFSGAGTCCTACKMSQAMPSGEQPCPVPALCPQAMFLSHFWKMVHVKHCCQLFHQAAGPLLSEDLNELKQSTICPQSVCQAWLGEEGRVWNSFLPLSTSYVPLNCQQNHCLQPEAELHQAG